ncbi:MAG: hypothetical protein WA771_05755 [Chthoniobacterales bacterium]
MKIATCLAAFSALFVTGCLVGPDGRFVPPDPIGRAIFGVRDTQEVYYDDDRYYEEDEIYVTSAPPRPRYERRPAYAPSSYRDPVYIDGYYDYGNTGWFWRPGRYVERPRANVRWVQGSVYTRGGSRYYRRGYWR